MANGRCSSHRHQLGDRAATAPHPDGQIASIIRQGGVKMPAVWPEWTDGEITAVLAYVEEWWTQEQRAEQARSSDAFR